ncbi:hypothetical protein [Geobacter sp.]|uniref:hypothetical protein n=1 Tax=Geobacter sp. TaxID=46610 RepID=UPI00262887B0|nr:hypothetical protein [Geobacter sp.]
MHPQVQELFNKAQQYGLSRIICAVKDTYPEALHPAFDATIDEIAEEWHDVSINGLKDQLTDAEDPEALETFDAIKSIAQQAANLLLEAHPAINRDKAVRDLTVVTSSIAAHYDTALNAVENRYIADHREP